jgi:prepilin-type N-terminal cleavage/methylation domain-containing protein
MKKKISLKNQKGFTLIEIAIVLVIIGLLIGGVLKGQSMIQNAKVKRLAKDIEGMQAAVIAYQDRYQMLPGDENDPNTPPGDTNNAAGGNANNGRLDETNGWEIQDLRCAQLIGGAPTSIILPTNTYGGTISADWVTIQGGTFNWIVVTNIPGEVCQEIDTKYDDGVQTTGTIRGSAAYVPDTIVATLGWRLN